MTHEVELDVLAPDAVSLEVADGGSVGWDTSEFMLIHEIPAERYEGPYAVAPSGAEQVLATDGLLMEDDVTVQAAPLAYEERTVSASGTIEIAPPAGSYGLSGASVTVPAGKVTMRKPTMDEAVGEIRSRADVTAGYVTGGSYGGSALILDKQAGTTITPTESEQVAVAQYRWTTGAVKVAAIPSQYIVPTGTYTVTGSGTHDVTAHASASVPFAATRPKRSSTSTPAVLPEVALLR